MANLPRNSAWPRREWYACPIPRKRLKELMQRAGRSGDPRHPDLVRAARITGWLGCHFWGTWWCVPASSSMACYTAPARIRAGTNAAIGTAFKTTWMNDVVYEMASFMVHARIHAVALEPHAPSHRHHHRRARPGNRRAAPARHRGHNAGLLQPQERAQGIPTNRSCTARPTDGGGENVHSRIGSRKVYLDARASRP